MKKTRTADELAAQAERIVNGRIIDDFDFTADIVAKTLTFEELEDGIMIKALITTNERIDMERLVETVHRE